MRRLAWIVVLAGCTAPVQHAPAHDADVADAPPPDGWAVIGHPGILLGGSDAGAGGCAARILVVFDRSLSMESPWISGGTSAPRWQLAETALASAVSPRASQLSVGALLFPSSDPAASACAPVDPISRQIPFAPGSAFLAAWAATWSHPTLYGSTPIDTAFDAADAALAGAGAETAVVLLTDGEPTCSGAVAAEARAAAWRARGIRTFVVGLPGSSAGAAYLAGIASAGGTGSALAVDDPRALDGALATIASDQVQGQCGP